MQEYEFYDLSDTGKKYDAVLNTKLADVEVKHIARIDKSNHHLIDLAQKVGYEWALLGARKEFSVDDARERVEGMSRSWIERPIKIVLTKDGRIWADNTHWSMSYVKKYGKDTLVGDVPFYIVDLRKRKPVIVSYNDSVKQNHDDIIATVKAAQEINKRLGLGWRPEGVYYKLSDLMHEIWA